MEKVKLIIEAYKKLPDDQKGIFYKYMGVMPILATKEENCKQALAFAEENGINLITAKALVRFICEDINNSKERFNAYKEAGYERIIINNPELIRFDAKEVLLRINQCIKAGKGVEIDGRFAEFLFDDLQWKTVKENLHIEDVTINELEQKGKDIESVDLHVSAKGPNKEGLQVLENVLFVNDAVDLDSEQFERYLQITELLGNVREAMYGVNADAQSAKISSDMVISKLVGNSSDITPGNNLSNKDIIKACLYYCNGDALQEGVNEVIDSLAVFQEDKRGL